MRVIVAGGPGTGKSWLGRELLNEAAKVDLLSTPALLRADPISLGGDATREDWEGNSVEVAAWFDRPGNWVIEGVKTVYALRRWLQFKVGEDILGTDGRGGPAPSSAAALAAITQPPCDRLIVLSRRHPRSGPPKAGHMTQRDGVHRKLDDLLARWEPLAKVVEWR